VSGGGVGVAMGWGRTAMFRHAQRLERAGWVVRCAMGWGQGSLLVPTRSGVLVSGVAVTAAAVPEPTWWAHLSGVGGRRRG
jgi:hypothetical protein